MCRTQVREQTVDKEKQSGSSQVVNLGPSERSELANEVEKRVRFWQTVKRVDDLCYSRNGYALNLDLGTNRRLYKETSCKAAINRKITYTSNSVLFHFVPDYIEVGSAFQALLRLA